MDELRVGDRVRINADAKCNAMLQDKLATVTMLRDWGIVANVTLHGDDIPGGVASGYSYVICPVRLATGDFTLWSAAV